MLEIINSISAIAQMLGETDTFVKVVLPAEMTERVLTIYSGRAGG